MADTLMGIEEVAKELQLEKEQIVELVKKGMLRGFMDQKTYKFRAPDVEAYKKKLASSATRLSEGKEEKKDATSKVDLAEIESDAGIDESDQTSVLAPADESEDHLTVKPEDTPVFQFSDKELGLEDEEGSGVEEADQTSLMMPAEEAKEEAADQKPEFDFDAQKPSMDDEPSDAVIVPDDTESSVDILDVADESSSDSSSSAMDLSDESGTGDEVVALSDIEESPKPMPPVSAAPPAKGAAAAKDTASTTVSDLLGQVEEGSEEELETLDIEEVADTGEAAAEEISKIAPDTTDTGPIADEAETVGIAGAGGDTSFKVGDEVETAGVSDAVAEALKEATGEEAVAGEAVAEEAEEAAPLEEAEEAAEGRVVVPTGWEMVTPSLWFNGWTIAASIMMVVGGAFLFCDAFDIQNGYTQQVVDSLKNLSFP